MTVLWITFPIVLCCGYFARRYSGNVVTTNGIVESKPNAVFTLLAMTILVLVSGLRNNIGDTGYYIYSFVNSIPYIGEPGFDLFQNYIKEFISTDPQSFILICALITNVAIVIMFYKHSAVFELSLFLYIATGSYLVSMNGIRQYLVAAVIFLCTQLIVKGKWLPFFAIVLVASTFHTSVLIFIPVYFFVRLKPWSKLVVLTLFSSLVILLLFNQTGNFLFDSLVSGQYAAYKESILTEGNGANVIRVLVAAVPVVLSYLGRKEIEKNNDELINILINFSVLNIAFYILALQNWIFARMCIYFGLYVLLLLPWLIKNLFDKKSSSIVYIGCLVFYTIYYYFEIESYLNFWQVGYRSDFIGF